MHCIKSRHRFLLRFVPNIPTAVSKYYTSILHEKAIAQNLPNRIEQLLKSTKRSNH